MRQLVQKRKERLQAEREAEAEREAHELVMKKEQEDSERRKVKKEKVLSKKRSRDEVDVDAEEEQARRRESLPSTGAHGLARQDGLNVHQGVYCHLPNFIRGLTFTVRLRHYHVPSLRAFTVPHNLFAHSSAT